MLFMGKIAKWDGCKDCPMKFGDMCPKIGRYVGSVKRGSHKLCPYPDEKEKEVKQKEWW